MRTMTAPVPTPAPAPAARPLSRAQALAVRSQALHALDQSVRTVLERRLPVSQFGPMAAFGLTVYDALYPALGGHWTVAYRRPMGFFHTVLTLTIALEFDRAHRPARFRVTGATEVTSADATLESLDAALEHVLTAGLLQTTAPSFVPGFTF